VFQLVLIQNKEIVWSKNFGVADASILQTAVNDKTMFEACSMSKPVFAYLVLKLVEQGKLDLDKPLYNICQKNLFVKMITIIQNKLLQE
jgi:CubicO group peptidase (beta-lactamase class C family)